MFGFREGYALENVNLIKFQMADLRPFLHFITGICVISEKLCQKAQQNVWF